MKTCSAPVSFELLVAYWAGDLDAPKSDAIEEHVFSCEVCTAASARVATVTEGLRALVPPIVTRAFVDGLRARGFKVEDNIVLPETPGHVTFTLQDFIIHHLSGLDLADAARVDVSVRVEETDEVLADEAATPFDAAAGEVLVACQRHFSTLPPNIVFVVATTNHGGARREDRFYVSHAFA